MLDSLKNLKQSLQSIWSPFKEKIILAASPLIIFLRPVTSKWDGFKQKKPNTAKWVNRLAKLFILFYFVILIFDFGVFGACPSVNDLKELQNKNASEVYSSDSVLLGRFYFENRTNVKFEDISKDVVNALVATEDARFFVHGGIDYRSWLRVIFKSVLKNDDSGGGGSTLSQQLAKNLFPRKKHWFFTMLINKTKEMIIATRLEKAYSKKDLLTFYLNTVPFGNNAFGIEIASKRYFSKTPKTLTTEEAATLVGMLKATTFYNPKKNPKNALTRRNVVLAQMVKYKYLDSLSYDSLRQLQLVLKYNKQSDGGLAGYFREYLKQELPEILKNYPKNKNVQFDIFNDGLKIYTTIDSKLQKYAEEAMEEHMSKIQAVFDNSWRGQKPWVDDKFITEAMMASPRYKLMQDEGISATQILKVFNTPTECTIFSWKGDVTKKMTPLDSIKYYFCMLNLGFMAMDPKTGNIKAWIGGNDFKYTQYDHVKARRQVGSTFKPIVYAAALEQGVRPCEYIPNKVIKFRYYDKKWVPFDSLPKGTEEDTEHKDWEPHNVDESYGGSYSMQGALTKSVNVATVATIHKIGVQPVVDLARAMGVTSPFVEAPSIALGTADLSLYEMISVYGTFAKRGKKVLPNPILKIITADGKEVLNFEHKSDTLSKNILKEENADVMIQLLKSVIEQGTGGSIRYAYGVNTDFAGKTGTTQNSADGWFVGFSPNIVVGAWVGAESQIVRFRESNYGQGSYLALPVCGKFVKKMYDDPKFAYLKNEKFVTPAKWIMDSLNCPLKKYEYGEIIDDIDTSDILEIPDSINTKMLDELDKIPEIENDEDIEEKNSNKPTAVKEEMKDIKDKETKDKRADTKPTKQPAILENKKETTKPKQ
jgi:penicillin-binding protein 1A